ncbi:hypothetical protein AbraIFM66951_001965 [Aspergillus brasiliensis]|nr:hypothetical protein AbraIFM66951_001965 [Aspergillus brasiliensis]
MNQYTQTIVVGLDVGMTFTGVVVGRHSPGQRVQFEIVSAWPGQTSLKVPSTISYPEDSEPLWGFQAHAYSPTYAWFKPLLDPTTPYDDFQEIVSYANLAELRLVTLAPGKGPSAMIGDYLRQVYRFVLNYLGLVNANPHETRFQYCFFTPVIWEENAQLAMRRAICEAGFGNAFPGHVKLSSESEASATYFLDREGSALKAGDVFCLCDLGGYTMDSATYRVFSREPALRLTQITKSCGLRCGAIKVEVGFFDLMIDRFKGDFERVFRQEDGLTSQFMQDFTRIKEGFNGSNVVHRLRLDLGAVDSKFYDSQKMEILLSLADLQHIFQPVISQSLDLMSRQLNEADQECRLRGEGRTTYLVITGGFANSPYAKAHYEDFAAKRGVQLVIPENPAIATAYGSAISGVHDVTYTQKKCARTYGLQHDDLMLTKKGDKERGMSERIKERSNGVIAPITWLFRKGNMYEESFNYTRRFELLHSSDQALIKTITVYSADRKTPPTSCEKADKSKLTPIDYVNLNLSPIPLDGHPHLTDAEGKTYYQIYVDVTTILCLKKGELNIECRVNGVLCGDCQAFPVWS